MREEKDQYELEEEEDFTRKRKFGRKGEKAPILYRIAAWSALVVICFGVGYYATSMVVGMLNRGVDDGEVSENIVSNTEELEEVLASGQDREKDELTSSGRSTFYAYIPSEGGMNRITFTQNPAAVMEDKIVRVLSMISTEAQKGSFTDRSFEILHVFRTGEILYIDMDASFREILINLDAGNASILMTGIVRSMVENFDPITRIRILIMGKAPAGLPVDLSVPWQLAPKA